MLGSLEEFGVNLSNGNSTGIIPLHAQSFGSSSGLPVSEGIHAVTGLHRLGCCLL